MTLSLEQYEKLNPRCELDYAGKQMVFAMTTSRVQSIHEKEPWTLEWITEFKPDDVMVDVGANVGMYTIIAAATRLTKVSL